VRKFVLLKKLLFILILLDFAISFAQKDTLPYNRKQEITYDNKRYRRWNNYLTFGAGKAYSTIRETDQSIIGVDFNFHMQKQYFQVGFLMSGPEYLTNTNVAGHICYGYRYEKNKYNLAGYVGPSYSYFVTVSNDTLRNLIVNNALGAYVNLQAVYKFKYDVGIGVELFADITSLQQMYGGKIILFFSGAYRGEKRGIRRK
jgi:hypothetical protein